MPAINVHDSVVKVLTNSSKNLTAPFSKLQMIHSQVQVLYSGKLSWEKTFAKWWKIRFFCGEKFRELLAGAANCTTKELHAWEILSCEQC